jgi:uncharacterized FlaG/YvyC family protein
MSENQTETTYTKYHSDYFKKNNAQCRLRQQAYYQRNKETIKKKRREKYRIQKPIKDIQNLLNLIG